MRKPLADRVALVIGATGGIGKAGAKAMADAGADVMISARSVSRIDDVTSDSSGYAFKSVVLDLAAPGTIGEAAETIRSLWGRLDILLVAGGVFGETVPVKALDADHLRQTVEVNFLSNAWIIQEFDGLLAASAAGRAIFIGSGAARSPRATWAPYCSTKAALEALIRCYALETAATSVRPTLLNPGAIRTKMRAAIFGDEPDGDIPPPEALQAVIVDLARAESEPDPITWYAEWLQKRAPKSA